MKKKKKNNRKETNMYIPYPWKRKWIRNFLEIIKKNKNKGKDEEKKVRWARKGVRNMNKRTIFTRMSRWLALKVKRYNIFK